MKVYLRSFLKFFLLQPVYSSQTKSRSYTNVLRSMNTFKFIDTYKLFVIEVILYLRLKRVTI